MWKKSMTSKMGVNKERDRNIISHISVEEKNNMMFNEFPINMYAIWSPVYIKPKENNVVYA